MMPRRDVGDGWVGWAVAQQGFGRSTNPISTTLLFAHPALGGFLHHCSMYLTTTVQ
jgi:hypothetical protein